MSVTPLQLARAYSVLATNGVLRPVSFLRTEDVIEGERIIAASSARQVSRMLEAVVKAGGTGTQAQIAGYKVAGKTGTVKKAVAGGYSEDRYIAVFAGIAPASQPRLAMVVTINEPRGDTYYGGEVAAPVFSKVMAGALRMMGIPPDDVSFRPLKIAALNHPAGGRP